MASKIWSLKNGNSVSDIGRLVEAIEVKMLYHNSDSSEGPLCHSYKGDGDSLVDSAIVMRNEEFPKGFYVHLIGSTEDGLKKFVEGHGVSYDEDKMNF